MTKWQCKWHMFINRVKISIINQSSNQFISHNKPHSYKQTTTKATRPKNDASARPTIHLQLTVTLTFNLQINLKDDQRSQVWLITNQKSTFHRLNWWTSANTVNNCKHLCIHNWCSHLHELPTGWRIKKWTISFHCL